MERKYLRISLANKEVYVGPFVTDIVRKSFEGYLKMYPLQRGSAIEPVLGPPEDGEQVYRSNFQDLRAAVIEALSAGQPASANW